MDMISIDAADYPSLKRHAEVNLGLEVKAGTNATTLRAKILQVSPDTKEIEQVQVAAPAQLSPAVPVASATGATVAPRYSINTPQTDPKVLLTINKTADMTRAREVDIMVNGYLWRAKRGERIEAPYRAYLALENAIEKRPVLSDRVSQFGNPIYDYEEVHSYPFTVHRFPSQEEIDAWEQATNSAELQAA